MDLFLQTRDTKPATVLTAVNDKPCGRPPKEGPSLTAAVRGGAEFCGRGGRMPAARSNKRMAGLQHQIP
jgi:hypothetical protein